MRWRRRKRSGAQWLGAGLLATLLGTARALDVLPWQRPYQRLTDITMQEDLWEVAARFGPPLGPTHPHFMRCPGGAQLEGKVLGTTWATSDPRFLQWAPACRGALLAVVSGKPGVSVYNLSGSPQSGILADAPMWTTVVPRWPMSPAKVHAVAFSKDGNSMFIAGAGSRVAAWDISEVDPKKWKEVANIQSHPEGTGSLAVSPNGFYLAMAPVIVQGRQAVIVAALARTEKTSKYQTAKKWGLKEGSRVIGEVLQRAVFSPCGRALVVASTNQMGQQAFVFTANHAMLMEDWDDEFHILHSLDAVLPIMAVTFSPDGRRLVFAHDMTSAQHKTEGLVDIWDTSESTDPKRWRQVRKLPGLPSGCVSLAFSADGRRLATAGNKDTVIRIWDVMGDEGYWAEVTQTDTNAQTRALAYSPDGQRLASITGKELMVWTTTDDQGLAAFLRDNETVDCDQEGVECGLEVCPSWTDACFPAYNLVVDSNAVEWSAVPCLPLVRELQVNIPDSGYIPPILPAHAKLVMTSASKFPISVARFLYMLERSWDLLRELHVANLGLEGALPRLQGNLEFANFSGTWLSYLDPTWYSVKELDLRGMPLFRAPTFFLTEAGCADRVDRCFVLDLNNTALRMISGWSSSEGRAYIDFCREGTWLLRTLGRNSATCEPCPAGTWSNATGQQGREACINCPPKRTTRLAGSVSEDVCECEGCPAGRALMHDADCTCACPPNTLTLGGVCDRELCHETRGTRCPSVGTTPSSVEVLSGWYRIPGSDLMPVRCPLESLCRGGHPPVCAPGSRGALCMMCDEGHFRPSSTRQCLPCYSAGKVRGLERMFEVSILLALSAMLVGIILVCTKERVREQVTNALVIGISSVLENTSFLIPKVKAAIVAAQQLQAASRMRRSIPIRLKIIDHLSLLSLDFWSLPHLLECSGGFTYYGKYLVALAMMGTLMLTGAVGARLTRDGALTYLVPIYNLTYIPVLTKTIALFACDSSLRESVETTTELYGDLHQVAPHVKTKRYLREDYSLECDTPTHHFYWVLGCIVMTLWFALPQVVVFAYMFRMRRLLNPPTHMRSALFSASGDGGALHAKVMSEVVNPEFVCATKVAATVEFEELCTAFGLRCELEVAEPGAQSTTEEMGATATVGVKHALAAHWNGRFVEHEELVKIQKRAPAEMLNTALRNLEPLYRNYWPRAWWFEFPLFLTKIGYSMLFTLPKEWQGILSLGMPVALILTTAWMQPHIRQSDNVAHTVLHTSLFCFFALQISYSVLEAGISEVKMQWLWVTGAGFFALVPVAVLVFTCAWAYVLPAKRGVWARERAWEHILETFRRQKYASMSGRRPYVFLRGDGHLPGLRRPTQLQEQLRRAQMDVRRAQSEPALELTTLHRGSADRDQAPSTNASVA